MEARSVATLPTGEGWQFEPKWDGFRCLAFKAGADVALQAKSGKSLSRYFPEMLEALRAIPLDMWVLDGELTVPVADTLSFEALQDRLHPAESRIRKLAASTPARLILFDCLATKAESRLLDAPMRDRRDRLEQMAAHIGPNVPVRLTPFTRDRDEAQEWLDNTGGPLDGVVAKRLDSAYAPGARALLKIKKLRSADCVVGGFRYAAGTRVVGSLLLGLYNDAGLLDHVGFTSGLSAAERIALTPQLERLRGTGFSGDAPGGPSRWSTDRSADWVPLRPELVVEVSYDHVSGGRFRHGTALLRWRPDKAAVQCTMEQLR